MRRAGTGLVLVFLAGALLLLWSARSREATAVDESPGVSPWPPRLGEAYPDLELIDTRGRVRKLSSYRGKVLLIEPVSMTCAACQAFSGAHVRGPSGDVKPQSGLQSIEEYVPAYARGTTLDDPGIVFIQIVFLDWAGRAPSADGLARWSRHFGFDRRSNGVVLGGTERLVGETSRSLIPGFQLVDKRFVLRSDSTGNPPRQSLWEHLLPMIPRLLGESAS